jgi:DNA excision repair protein ERCC-3
MSEAAEADGDSSGARRIKITIKPPTAKEPGEADDVDNVQESDAEDSDDDGVQEKDWTDLIAKKDHSSRPLYVGKDRHIFVEKFSPFFRYIEDFIIAIAEPVSRCEYIHEYEMTQHSLHAAVSIGLNTSDILKKLEMLCKTKLPSSVEHFIRSCTDVYGKVKMVIVDNSFYLETSSRSIFELLSSDPEIIRAKTGREGQVGLRSPHHLCSAHHVWC